MLDPTPPGQRLGETPLLQTVGLTKRYGNFLANDKIDIDIWPGQIHALLGENGAGKSTLVKAIYGLIQPSDGEMRWQGEKMTLSGPSEARARGIGMVFQHFSLFDNLTVAENVALGLDGKESFKDMSARLEEVSNVYGLPLDPRREVWQLSVGERQRIEIVRALMQNPKFLILDEPTAVLTPQEADQLFVVLDRLKSEGRAILYISHKLEEVKRLCDTATILPGGNLQKFIVGREILRNPAVLVVSQPTWGVDAGAAAVIRQALLDLAAGGAAVLVTSQDLDELAEITDRIAVMFHGRLSEPMVTADATREKLGLLMGGSSLEQKEAAHAVSA